MTTRYRSLDVVDADHRLIGTISDVVHDRLGEPMWAVVDLGLLRSSHYLPIASGRVDDHGDFVVPFDKSLVKAAPRADRRHVVDAATHSALVRHYAIAH